MQQHQGAASVWALRVWRQVLACQVLHAINHGKRDKLAMGSYVWLCAYGEHCLVAAQQGLLQT